MSSRKYISYHVKDSVWIFTGGKLQISCELFHCIWSSCVTTRYKSFPCFLTCILVLHSNSQFCLYSRYVENCKYFQEFSTNFFIQGLHFVEPAKLPALLMKFGLCSISDIHKKSYARWVVLRRQLLVHQLNSSRTQEPLILLTDNGVLSKLNLNRWQYFIQSFTLQLMKLVFHICFCEAKFHNIYSSIIYNFVWKHRIDKGIAHFIFLAERSHCHAILATPASLTNLFIKQMERCVKSGFQRYVV